jgi:methylglutaconyl-CoA hydratase
MSGDSVIFERRSEAIAESVLNRPEKRNALSIEMMRRLCAHADRITKDGTIRIWILKSNGPAFCAGLDVAEAADPRLSVESAGMVKACLSVIYQMPVVTVAMVHGAAMGGGAGLVAACDFAVADRDATIGFPEVRRGLIPAQVMTLLVRKIKIADVKQLLLSGESINAERALQMGLFNRTGNIDREAREIVSQVLQNAPGATAKTKQLIDSLYSRALPDDIEKGMRAHVEASGGAEGQEGIRAFLEKRKPAWHKSWK